MAKLLIFVDHYLPGHKFGGPVRTLSNLVSKLSSRFELFIFTGDRDEGDEKPYANIEADRWVSFGGAQVFYSNDSSLWNIRKRITDVRPQAIYLNSFFSRTTIKVLVGRRLGLLPSLPTLLSPRGEFADGALAIRPLRKSLYIKLVNAAGLLKNVQLAASTELEQQQLSVRLQSARMQSPRIALDVFNPQKIARMAIVKQPGRLKILFLSRISRNKNLLGAIKMLSNAQGHVQFDICGPIGDRQYYSDCEEEVRRLPGNISVKYLGDVPHAKVPDVLGEHHLMFLPTLGENFGHAIAEALAAGRPVLISDRTPWRDLEARGVGADIPLDQTERFRNFLQLFIDMGQEEFDRRSGAAREYAVQVADNPEHLQNNVRLIQDLIEGDK